MEKRRYFHLLFVSLSSSSSSSINKRVDSPKYTSVTLPQPSILTPFPRFVRSIPPEEPVRNFSRRRRSAPEHHGTSQVPGPQGPLPLRGLSEPPDQVRSSRTSARPAGFPRSCSFQLPPPPRLHLNRAANQTQQGVRKVRKRRRRQMEVKEAAGAAAIRACL